MQNVDPAAALVDTGHVSSYIDWRSARPGRWLVAALAASVATYATAPVRSGGVPLWILLDLWLAHRIWRGGAIALAWFQGLQILGVVLFGTVLFATRWVDLATGAGPHTVLLFALSAWCLTASALSRHVARVPVER